MLLTTIETICIILSTAEETIKRDVEAQNLHGSCVGEFEVSLQGTSVRGRRGLAGSTLCGGQIQQEMLPVLL